MFSRRDKIEYVKEIDLLLMTDG